MFRTKLL